MLRAHLRCETTAKALGSFTSNETFGSSATGLRQRKGAAREMQAEVPPVVVGVPVVEGMPADVIAYTVGVGESLRNIALRHGMRVEQLRRWNKLISPNVFPGQKLLVMLPPPQRATTGGCAPSDHEVRAL